MTEELIGLFDTHAHPTDERFNEDREQVLARMREAGMLCMCVGADMASSAQSVVLANENENIYAAVGVHPHDAKDFTEADIPQLTRWLMQEKKVKALGEIGLDYYYNRSEREVQRKAFRRQLALARELDLPVVIHSRDAAQDTLEIVREYRPRGVVHCFSYSAEQAREYVELGMYLGFTGVVTFPNAKKPLEAAAAVPLDRILIETDCPYMAPEPHRGERNHSGYVRFVAEKMAAVKGVSYDEICRITYENGRRFFNI